MLEEQSRKIIVNMSPMAVHNSKIPELVFSVLILSL